MKVCLAPLISSKKGGGVSQFEQYINNKHQETFIVLHHIVSLLF